MRRAAGRRRRSGRRLAVGAQAQAALNVVACEPEWASLAKEIGGDRVNVSSATTATQDPHRIEARPSLIARMRNADLVVCTGLDLEVGWLPMLVQQSGNARLAPGSPGYFEAGRFVTPLEVPVRLDRSDGDVHAQGNPHIQLDPRNIAKVATALAERLARIDAPNAAAYQERLQAFQGRWSASVAKWEQQALPLKGVAVVSHHKNMSYLWAWLGVREVGTLEPKPGVEPSAGHLSALSASSPSSRPGWSCGRRTRTRARRSGWPTCAQRSACALPFTVGGNDKATDLFGLFDSTVALLLDGAK